MGWKRKDEETMRAVKGTLGHASQCVVQMIEMQQ
jgi:hypothetical protein